MDARLQILRRLASQGDVDAKTRLALWELGLQDRVDAIFSKKIAELIQGRAVQNTIWWLGGSWKGHSAFISIDPPRAWITPDTSMYCSDLFSSYFSMRSATNVNNFMFFRVVGVPTTLPNNFIAELSGHGVGAIYGANIYPASDPNRTYDMFEHRYETQRYWFQHPEDLLDRMASRIDLMDEAQETSRIERERWPDGIEEGEDD